jgi:hypothetical protein
MVLQLVKKFPAFYGTRKFITVLTSARTVQHYKKNLNLHQYLCEKRHIVTDVQEDDRVLDPEVEGAILVRNLGKFLPVETA